MRTWMLLTVALSACTGGTTTDPPPEVGCGDALVEPGEVCDGDGKPCAELGASFSSGTASCRSDCLGWNPSSCTLAMPGQFEAVKPAELGDSRWDDALCNDGTHFTFLVRVVPTSDEWMIYLQGGVYCDDNSYDCGTRAPSLTRTLPLANGTFDPSPPFGGLASADPAVNPDFYDVNQVVAQYCSSDLWTGDAATQIPNNGDPGGPGWYFSGHANLDAMLDVLTERYGLDDDKEGLKVLFTGGSAGGLGLAYNTSRIIKRIPSTADDGRLHFLMDAGWYTEFDDPAHRIGMATDPDHDVFAAARAFWMGTFEPDCEAQETDPVACFYGDVWYPHLKAYAPAVPVLIQQCELDNAFALNDHHIDPAVDTVAADAWSTATHAYLMAPEWLFSAQTGNHTLVLRDDGLDRGPAGGTTLRELISHFWADETPERVTF